MRNYYRSLHTTASADADELNQRIEQLWFTDPHLAERMKPVLTSAQRKLVYDRVHAQYAAIAAVRTELAEQPLLDTNDWERRLVEFEST